jgi:hypothetical protein
MGDLIKTEAGVSQMTDAELLLFFRLSYKELAFRQLQRHPAVLQDMEIRERGPNQKVFQSMCNRCLDQVKSDLLFSFQPRKATMILSTFGGFFGIEVLFRGLIKYIPSTTTFVTWFRNFLYVFVVSSWCNKIHESSFLFTVPVLAWICGLYHVRFTDRYQLDGLLSMLAMFFVLPVLAASQYALPRMMFLKLFRKLDTRPTLFVFHGNSIQSIFVVSSILYWLTLEIHGKNYGSLGNYLFSIYMLTTTVPSLSQTQDLDGEDCAVFWVVRAVSLVFFGWILVSRVLTTYAILLIYRANLVWDWFFAAQF